MMNIKILLAIAVLTVWAAVVLVVNLRWESSKGEAEEARATTEIAVELETAQARTEQTEALNRMETDDQVVRSILKGLEISIEIQPQWEQEVEFLLQVNLEKPLGTVYLVDAIEDSCILYVNNRPWTLLRRHERSHDRRQVLTASTGSTHPVWRIAPDLPDPCELVVEWVHYNPRSKKIERIRTAPYAYRVKGCQLD